MEKIKLQTPANKLILLASFLLFSLIFVGRVNAWSTDYSTWQYRTPITIQENSGNTLTDYQVKLTIDTASLIASGKMNSDCSDMRFSFGDWQYRLPVTVTENSGSDLTDYQIKIQITDATAISHMNSDCSDIRVVDSDTGKKLPYWVETCDVVNNNIVIWTKVNLTALSTKTLYVYYGNPNAVSESDGNAVFDFFDDFKDGVIDGTIQATKSFGSVSWTATENNGILILENPATGSNGAALYVFNYVYSNNEMIEARIQDPDTGDNSQMGVTLTSSTEDIVARRIDAETSNVFGDYITSFTTSGASDLTSISLTTDTNYHILGLLYDGLNIYMFVDYNNELSVSYTLSDTYNIGIYSAYQTGTTINVDWFRVRKYTSPEPTVTIGTEETSQWDEPIPYWIESGCNSTSTIVWVKIPQIPASSTSTIYMYYGNPTATSESNGDDVFEFFDDFDDGIIDTNKWIDESSTTGGTEGVWEEVNGEMRQTADAVADTKHTSQIFSGCFKIYTEMQTDDTNYGWVGISLLQQDYNDYYVIAVDELNNQARIFKYVAGTASNIAYASIDYGTNWVKLVVSYCINNITAIFDDGITNVVVSGIDTSFTSGYVGLSSNRMTITGGSDKWRYYFVTKYASSEPTYSLGTEEIQGTTNLPPQITIFEPQNTTYYTNNIQLNFTVTDDANTTFSVQAYFGDQLIYDNANYQNDTIVVLNLSSYITQGGSYYVKVVATDTDPTPLTSEKSVYFYIWQGVSVITQLPNNTVFTNYIINAKNDTYEINYTLTTSPYKIEWKDLPQGNVVITPIVDGHDNETWSITVSPLMGYHEHLFIVYPYSYFKAKDSNTGQQIQSFTVTVGNKEFSTTNGVIQVSNRELPSGDTNATYTAYGYLNYTLPLTIDPSTSFTVNPTLTRASLIINFYDEETFTQLSYFNLTITNGTVVKQYNVEGNQFIEWTINLPMGLNTITIEDYNKTYATRKYYIDVTPYTTSTIDAYLLKLTSGFWVTLQVVDTANNPVSDAYVTVYKFINNTWKTISQYKTQIDGTASFFLKPNVNYHFKITKSSSVKEFDYSPDVNIRLVKVIFDVQQVNITLDEYTRYSGLRIIVNPENNMINANQQINITYEAMPEINTSINTIHVYVYEAGNLINETYLYDPYRNSFIFTPTKEFTNYMVKSYIEYVFNGKQYNVYHVASWYTGISQRPDFRNATGPGATQPIFSTTELRFGILIIAMMATGFLSYFFGLRVAIVFPIILGIGYWVAGLTMDPSSMAIVVVTTVLGVALLILGGS